MEFMLRRWTRETAVYNVSMYHVHDYLRGEKIESESSGN